MSIQFVPHYPREIAPSGTSLPVGNLSVNAMSTKSFRDSVTHESRTLKEKEGPTWPATDDRPAQMDLAVPHVMHAIMNGLQIEANATPRYTRRNIINYARRNFTQSGPFNFSDG